jgi:drug/metabolite transporter (DMT)-like permease
MILLAALLHAVWNTLVKTSSSGFLFIILLHSALAIGAVFFIPFVPFPATECWRFLKLSVLIHLVYHCFLAMAYRHGDLSFAYPLARGTGPIVVALLSPLFVGENLSIAGYLGVFATSLGIVIVSYNRGLFIKADRRATTYAIGTGCLIGLYTMADGMGVRLSGSTAGYIVWLFAIEGVATFLMGLIIMRSRLITFIGQNWKRGLAAATMSGGAYGIVIWALAFTEMAYIAALRETSVLFAAIIGATFLKEPFGRRRVFGSLVVATGVILLYF